MFEGNAKPLGVDRRGGRALALAVSVIAHLGALGWFVWRGEEREGGRMVEVVMFSRPLAGAADRPMTAAERQADRERRELAKRLTQPVLESEAGKNDLAAKAEGAAAGGSEAGAEAEAAGSAAAAEENAPEEAGGRVTRPRVIEGTRVEPAYTHQAEEAGVMGDVVLKAVIDQRGNVTHLEVLRGLPYGLSEAAVAAVRRWKFQPSTRDGKPVRVYYILTVHFRPQPV